jgi:hypothetical protein
MVLPFMEAAVRSAVGDGNWMRLRIPTKPSNSTCQRCPQQDLNLRHLVTERHASGFVIARQILAMSCLDALTCLSSLATVGQRVGQVFGG